MSQLGLGILLTVRVVCVVLRTGSIVWRQADFDNDLREVLLRAGCTGEKVCFIFDESNVLESSFLERMNAILASGEVPGLFDGDEYTALIQQCRDQWRQSQRRRGKDSSNERSDDGGGDTARS